MSLNEISPKVAQESDPSRGLNIAITADSKALNQTIPSESIAEHQTSTSNIQDDIGKPAHKKLLFADPVAFR